MAKQKTIPELEAEKAENERKITQLQHKKQQLENRCTARYRGFESLPLREKQSNNERVSTQKLTLFLYFKGFERRDGGFVTRS